MGACYFAAGCFDGRVGCLFLWHEQGGHAGTGMRSVEMQRNTTAQKVPCENQTVYRPRLVTATLFEAKTDESD